MTRLGYLKAGLAGGAAVLVLAPVAYADQFNIPGGDLSTALDAYMTQTRIELVVPDSAITGARTSGVKGNLTADVALSRILSGTGFMSRREGNALVVVPQPRESKSSSAGERLLTVADAAPSARAAASVETVVVTSSKIKGDIQTVPIAITALSQEQLTSRQIAGGPDLVKEVPNLTFSKTNFTGYNIQIRGIGTQAISVTTDPAVAVALNDTPFIRNHFFEQEFYDLSQAEVLRGPQGTLYGRNATAGVVNIVSAKPTDQFEAMLSTDWGNYTNRRYEGMVNIPIVDDRLDLRIAGEWTKRDGYSFNEITGDPIDGRDLWSSRVTLGWKPAENVQAYLVWEHFQESDDRLRSGKQLCKTAQSPTEVDGVPIIHDLGQNRVIDPDGYLNQGCVPTSLYSPDAFEVPNGNSIAYYNGFAQIGAPIQGGYYNSFDPYASTTQSQNLRAIESSINPTYRAKNDTLELNADYNVTPALTFTSQTGFNNDFLWSAEDFNRFNTRPGAFAYCDPSGVGCDGLSPNSLGQLTPDPDGLGYCSNTYGSCSGSTPYVTRCAPDSSNFGSCQQDGVFCDPQVGCSDRLVLEDLSDEHSWQLSQEFRLASNFSGPLNFSAGGNYLHYETEENYYVFINSITLLTASHNPSGSGPFLPWQPGITDNSYCSQGWFSVSNPKKPSDPQSNTCVYVDPNPLTRVNNEGHNYFLSQNPYVLNSYAGFGEVYYNVSDDVKLTGGLRWTSDHKHFTDIPSELLVEGYGYPITGVVDQQWNKWTGRAVANWTPKLDFTDQTLLYASYSHGYKGGGANPPGAVLLENGRGGEITNPIHPLTFLPEFVDAFELGTKNTLLDGGLTFNGDVFYYNYKNYQISRIVDRTSINDNFNATVRGAEVEASWEPAPGLKFNFAGGYENATLDNGDHSVDLMDRTAGNPNWMVVKPFVTQASNCILPTYVVAGMLLTDSTRIADSCGTTYSLELDPVTNLPYVANPTERCSEALPANVWGPNCGPSTISGYAGFNPLQPAINNGQGFDKDLSGNQLPNAPHFTTSLSAEYTMPVSADWAATLHSDFYWQSQSFARVFNDRPYDKLRGYSNVNLALILTSADGWQVMGYLKNIFDTTAITGAFLNSDDTALTTNVFLTDPRLFGVRVTKNF